MEAVRPGNGLVVLRVCIGLLTAVTAAIHLSLLFPDPVFILNAVGYVALLTTLYAPVPGLKGRKPLVRSIFVGYTALTIVLWILIGLREPLAYIAKVDEVALIVLLLLERSRLWAEV